MRPIAIVDYGVGNLHSAHKAVEHAGHAAEITSDPERIVEAPGVVLPGQGAFGTCMQNLAAAGLVEPVRRAARSGRPFLGICIGMQLLFEESEESPGIRGLGILPGRVVRFQPHPDRKIPHMGWNQLHVVRRPPVLADVAEGAYVYFLHSYHVVPADAALIATTTSYGVDFVSSVAADGIFAGVFHPEKSQRTGLGLLANFVRTVGRA